MIANRAIAGSLLIACAAFTGSNAGDVGFVGVERTKLLHHDLTIPGHEVIQVLVEFAQAGTAAIHTHPGEELVYVVEGTLEYSLEGEPAVIITAGQTLFIPSGLPHGVKNVGRGSASELATYIVEKGKPLVALHE